eukprot:1154045-Pelagomonas_calceolata.AAC.5
MSLKCAFTVAGERMRMRSLLRNSQLSHAEGQWLVMSFKYPHASDGGHCVCVRAHACMHACTSVCSLACGCMCALVGKQKGDDRSTGIMPAHVSFIPSFKLQKCLCLLVGLSDTKLTISVVLLHVAPMLETSFVLVRLTKCSRLIWSEPELRKGGNRSRKSSGVLKMNSTASNQKQGGSNQLFTRLQQAVSHSSNCTSQPLRDVITGVGELSKLLIAWQLFGCKEFNQSTHRQPGRALCTLPTWSTPHAPSPDWTWAYTGGSCHVQDGKQED